MAKRKSRRAKSHVQTPAPSTAPKFTLRKKLGFAAITSVAALCLCELILWIAGVDPAYYREDPYAGFALHIPSFVPHSDTDGRVWLRPSPSKYKVFNTHRFLATKPAGVYRVVCVGGSTTYGRPFFDKTSFAGWLRVLLPAADPSQTWEVINAGAMSYASYRVAGVMKELAQYHPDLFIVYTGHNEFLERRTYEDLAEAPWWVTDGLALVSRTRTATVIRGALDLAGLRRTPTSRRAPSLGQEVHAIPINAVGPEAYHRDDDLACQVTEHFRATLERMAHIAEEAGAEILFVAPASNLAHFAPFKSEHLGSLRGAQLAEWTRHYDGAQALGSAGRHEAALRALAQAEAIDDRYARLLYLKGQLLAALERFTEAKDAFRRARNEDVCPLRAIDPIIQTVREVAAAQGGRCIDFEQLVDRRSAHGLAGRTMFHDHVHPTVDATGLLALAIVEYLAGRGIVDLDASWDQAKVDRLTEQVVSSMDRPAHAGELRKLASMLAWLKQPEQARYQAELSLELSGRSAAALLDLADRLHQVGAPAIAGGYYEEAKRQTDLELAPARTYIGSLRTKAGKSPLLENAND